jgi:hypothetical protein
MISLIASLIASLITVFVELRLRRALAVSAMLGISTDCYLIASFIRQALASSAMLGVPNAFRCAVACDAFERVAPLTGRFEGTLIACGWPALHASAHHSAWRPSPAGLKECSVWFGARLCVACTATIRRSCPARARRCMRCARPSSLRRGGFSRWSTSCAFR